MENKEVSKCCEAKLLTDCGEEGTCCWICSSCGKPTDPKDQKWWVDRFDSYIVKFLTTDTSKTVVKDFARQVEQEAYERGYKIGLADGTE